MSKAGNSSWFSLRSATNFRFSNSLFLHRLIYFYSSLLENHVHFLAHYVVRSKCWYSEITGLLVMTQRLLELINFSSMNLTCLRYSCSTAMLCNAITITVNLSSFGLGTGAPVFGSIGLSPWESSPVLAMSSSYIRSKAFIAWWRASSCFPIWERIAQMFKWISQGFEIFRLSSTGL